MTTLLGYMESYKLRMRVETLESFLKVIRLMETEMRFSLMMKDVYEIVGEAIGAGSIPG